MARQKRSAERESYWRLALDQFQTSVLSVRAFCAGEGLSQASFYAWRGSLRQRDAEPARASADSCRRVRVERQRLRRPRFGGRRTPRADHAWGIHAPPPPRHRAASDGGRARRDRGSEDGGMLSVAAGT